MQFHIQRRPIQLQETKDGDAQVTEVKTKLIENKKKGMPKRHTPDIALECTFLNVSFKLSITQQRCCR